MTEMQFSSDIRHGLCDGVPIALGYYDLILMDILMPNMDGYKATRIIWALLTQISKVL